MKFKIHEYTCIKYECNYIYRKEQKKTYLIVKKFQNFTSGSWQVKIWNRTYKIKKEEKTNSEKHNEDD